MKRPKIVRLRRVDPKAWIPPPHYGKSIIDQMIPVQQQIDEVWRVMQVLIFNSVSRPPTLLPFKEIEVKPYKS